MNISIKAITAFEKVTILEEVVFLICNGFKSKFIHLLFSEAEVHKLMYAFCHYIYTEKGENLLIALNNDKICGCLFLTSKADSYYHLFHSLSNFLSFSQRLKLIFLLGLLSHKPKANERYIDFITVSPFSRGQGIGTALISHCISYFPNERITLYVSKSNTIAYQLYQKLGFQVIKKDKNILISILTGVKEWHMMEWIK